MILIIEWLVELSSRVPYIEIVYLLPVLTMPALVEQLSVFLLFAFRSCWALIYGRLPHYRFGNSVFATRFCVECRAFLHFPSRYLFSISYPSILLADSPFVLLTA